MKYGIKVILKEDGKDHSPNYTRGPRGWESWIEAKKTWNSLNVVFNYCASINKYKEWDYEVEEMK